MKADMSGETCFRVLGPMRVTIGGREVAVMSQRERLLVAMLIVHAGEPVSTSLLARAIWGDDAPRNARNQLPACVYRLRKLLANAGGSRNLIDTGPDGYRLNVDRRAVDMFEFRTLRNRGKASAAAGEVAEASRCYQEALALWRGAPLAGMASPALQGIAQALGEERVQAFEEYVEVELANGRGGELVADLTELATEHPYRERLHGALMFSLYRAGRQAEALSAYRRISKRLRDELGADVGIELQSLHRAVLNRDPGLEARHSVTEHAATPVFMPSVAQTLPPAILDFVGREQELAVARAAIARHRENSQLPILVVTGTAGIGKSAFSLYLAHKIRDEYPDGQLFADLRGFDANSPAEPFEVLERFLLALGVQGAGLPETLDKRTDLYRSLLSGRHTLVVLDNARDDGQVTPLIPGHPGCAVIINSRLRLGVALGVEPVELGPLDMPSAFSMIRSLVGANRASAEPAQVHSLARLCGFLPLAIRVAGGKLSSKPHWTVGGFVKRLQTERSRLDHLSQGTLNVRASISLSYTSLTEDAKQLLRKLGDIGLPDVRAWAAAALMDTTTALAEDLLEQLFDAQLVQASSADDAGGTRYRLHDVVKLFASEEAEQREERSELRRARLRLFSAYLFAADQMSFLTYGAKHLTVAGDAPRWPFDIGGLGSHTSKPLQWFEAERTSFGVLIRRAAADGQYRRCLDLACETAPLFQIRGYYEERYRLLQFALREGLKPDDRHGRAVLLYRLGSHHSDRREFETAASQLNEASALFSALGDSHGAAAATTYLAMVRRFEGRYADAINGYQQAVPILRAHGDPGGEAFALRGIGQVHLELGDYSRSDRCLRQALDVCHTHGMRRSEAQVLVWQGMLRLRQERGGEAEELFGRVLKLCQELDDPSGQAQALRGLGLGLSQRGRAAEARAALLRALRLVVQPRPSILETFIRRDLAKFDRTEDLAQHD